MVSKERILEFKEKFTKRREEIIAANLQRAETLPEFSEFEGGDEADQVQGNMLKKMTEALSSREKENLSRINRALVKIHNGVFGDCEECGESISEPRLLAVPDCKYCIDCAEDIEKSLKLYKK